MPKAHENESNFEYEGFSSPNGTIVPDDVFDKLMPHLTDIELRVLLYIIRRTFGFKKNSDDISLSQIVSGITTQDGRVLDQGAGVSKPSAIKAVRLLEAKRIIVKQSNESAERGFEPTTYTLRFRGDPLSTGFTRGSKRDLQGLVNGVDIQQTELQETVEQQTENSNSFELVANLQKPSNFQNSKNRDKIEKSDAALKREPSARASKGSSQFTAVGNVLSAKTLRPPAKNAPRRPKKGSRTSDNAADESYSVSAKSSSPRAFRGRPPKATEQIEAVLEQISGEFHDADHLRSNVGQAARLWKASGLHENAFVSRLYEARSITKQRGDIQKRASGEAGEVGMRNRMPYFFVVVRDLLGMKGSEAP